jgi:hypothetical protein
MRRTISGVASINEATIEKRRLKTNGMVPSQKRGMHRIAVPQNRASQENEYRIQVVKRAPKIALTAPPRTRAKAADRMHKK